MKWFTLQWTIIQKLATKEKWEGFCYHGAAAEQIGKRGEQEHPRAKI